jgi:hypothetical protein
MGELGVLDGDSLAELIWRQARLGPEYLWP